MSEITDRIIRFNSDKIPSLVKLKYQFMAENMFRFFRGACHLFYEDIAALNALPPSPLSWICGDLHLENFGSFKGDNRLVYFDLNDFDEALLAPVSFEIIRIVTSILVAFKSLEIEDEKAVNMAQLFLKTYSKTLAKGKALYIEPQVAKGIVKKFLDQVCERKQSAILKKKTIVKKDRVYINKNDRKHLKLKEPLKQELFNHIRAWIKGSSDGPYNYEPVDCMFRIAGTGSVGLRRYAFLLKSLLKKHEYILIEMKEARPSSVLPFTQVRQPDWKTDAERIITIQQRMQNVSPALLSHTVFKDVPYIIQELQPTKDSISFKRIKENYRDLYQVIDDMAVLTASSQIRSAGREGSASADELVAFGQNDQWQKQILDLALSYVGRVGNDYNVFVEALRDGVFSG